MSLCDWFRRAARKTTEELPAEPGEHATASGFNESLSADSQILDHDGAPAIVASIAGAHSTLDADAIAGLHTSGSRLAAESPGSARAQTDAVCRHAEELLRSDRHAEAIGLLWEALESDRDHARAWELLVRAVPELGESSREEPT